MVVEESDDDTMSRSDIALATSSSSVHTSNISTKADSIDDDSDLDVLSGYGDLERTFELEDLTGNADASSFQGSAFGDGYEKANMHEEKAPRRKRSKKARFLLYTPAEERAVLRKLDRRLVLFMALLYMLSFLDRSSKYSRSAARSMLTGIHRHRERKNCWFVTRPAAELFTI